MTARPSSKGEEVVVVGGGNTAIDAARSALRVGAERVMIVYRRSPSEMPAIREEIDQAIEEGVELETLTQPVAIREEGERCVLTCRWMELGEPDESGRRRPIEIAGSDFELPCDRVILALGQSADLSVFPEGTEIRDGETLLGLIETPIFAVGDLATHDGTVAGAIGSGRRCALHIHETLSGELLAAGEHTPARRHVDVWRDEVVVPEAMKLHLFERVPRGDGGRAATVGAQLELLRSPSRARGCERGAALPVVRRLQRVRPLRHVLPRRGAQAGRQRVRLRLLLLQGLLGVRQRVPAQRHLHEPHVRGRS